MSSKIGQTHFPVYAADHREWLPANRVFEDIALVRNVANFKLIGAGEPERLLGARISANLLPALGVSPVLGRGFTEDEDEVGHKDVAILSDGLWRSNDRSDSAE